MVQHDIFRTLCSLMALHLDILCSNAPTKKEIEKVCSNIKVCRYKLASLFPYQSTKANQKYISQVKGPTKLSR